MIQNSVSGTGSGTDDPSDVLQSTDICYAVTQAPIVPVMFLITLPQTLDCFLPGTDLFL